MKISFLRGGILTLTCGGLFAFLLLRFAEPSYQGKTISAWQDDWASQKSRGWPEALQHIGTNAIPYAVQNLALNDSRWRSNYTRIQSKIPEVFKRFFPAPKPLLREVDVANVFHYIGSNSIPYAIALLKHHSPSVRRAAAWGFGSLRKQSVAANQALPALIDALADVDPQVCFDAALSIREMGADASNAVPALAGIVADRGSGSQTSSLFYLRAAAAAALGKIGPSAASSLPALRFAMQDSNSYLRGQAAVAIWRIDADVDSTLPILLGGMPGTIEDSKWDWIIALGEMGPRAKAAIPQLQSELKQDHYPWVLDYVTNALKSIGP